MGFIDQIMGAMGMEAAQTVTEEPTSNADPQRTEETKADEVKEKAEKIQGLDDGPIRVKELPARKKLIPGMS